MVDDLLLIFYRQLIIFDNRPFEVRASNISLDSKWNFPVWTWIIPEFKLKFPVTWQRDLYQMLKNWIVSAYLEDVWKT